MCGISGIYAPNGPPIEPTDLNAQLETIVHRGPNQGGTFVSPARICGLGSRRLSIIDVAGGDQPLRNEDGSIHLVYNGETYNHEILRAELAQLGHRPCSGSDAEVVLHGYEAWGVEGMLQRLRGMYAFALWDENKQQLLLARDRFGIKPLYYAKHAGRLIFGSEIKAILSQPNVPRRVNLTALQAMFTLGFVPGPATTFEGIYKLPPAHFMIARDGGWSIEKYWQLAYRQTWRWSLDDAADRFLELLDESVRLRLMSEAPLGALLSGGLDSGALVALMQASLPRPVKTVSIGFELAGYDEATLASDLARQLGTDHHPITFTGRDFELYPTAIRHLEEPQCAATALPIYRLYRACRQAGLTVVLTGEGADELLGGYHWHRGDQLARRLLSLPQFIRNAIAAAPLPMTLAARRVLKRGSRQTAQRYQDWLAVAGTAYRQRLFSAAVGQQLPPAGANPLLAGWAEKLAGAEGATIPQQLMWLEAQTRMVDFINFEVDKMSMASSIEARVPFLDHKLWEFCATLPDDFKIRWQTEKYLLRQATRSLLPEATRTRPKKGLASPYAFWLRQARLPDWAEAALSARAIRQTALFDVQSVQQLRQAVQAGQQHLSALLMGVLSTQLWFDCFIE